MCYNTSFYFSTLFYFLSSSTEKTIYFIFSDNCLVSTST